MKALEPPVSVETQLKSIHAATQLGRALGKTYLGRDLTFVSTSVVKAQPHLSLKASHKRHRRSCEQIRNSKQIQVDHEKRGKA